MNERSEKGREGGEKPTVPVRPGHRKSRPQWRRLLFPPPSLPLTLRRCLRRPWPHLPLGMLPGAGRRRGRPWGPAFPSGWGVKGGHRSRMGGRGGCLSVERAEVEVGRFQKVVGPLTGGFCGKEPDMNVETRLDFPTPSSPTTTIRTGLSRSVIIIGRVLPRSMIDRSKSPFQNARFRSKTPLRVRAEHLRHVLRGSKRVDGHMVQGRGGVSRDLLPACLRCVSASLSGIRTLPRDFHCGDGDQSVDALLLG